MSGIYASLAAVMDDCKAVAKRDRQEQQRYMFRGIDAVVNAVGPILRTHKVIVVPEVDDIAYAQVQTSTGKPSTACRLTVRYVFYAEDGSSITARVAGEAWDSADKATPKAMAVAWRTALIQALALPTDEPDPDATYVAHAPAQGEPPPTQRMSRDAITKAQLTKLHVCLGEAGLGTADKKDDALRMYAVVTGREVTSSKELTKGEAMKIIDHLEAGKAKPKDEDDSWANGSLPIDTDQ